MYRQRQLATALSRARAGFPAILITGPRQSGKTTFLRHEAGEQVDYVSFDDPLERDFASVDPAGFLDRFAKRPVILDEIQYVPALHPERRDLWLRGHASTGIERAGARGSPAPAAETAPRHRPTIDRHERTGNTRRPTIEWLVGPARR